MIKLSQAVIVEGKYDKIKLENIIDATIIPTNGFAIFKDKEKCDFIRLLARKNGIIVMTDSDSAGMVIRSHLKQICPENTIINVYIPPLAGKEKRKSKPSKQGLLGVEGMSEKIILDALKRSGVSGICDDAEKRKKVTKGDFYNLGLSGGGNSSLLRKSLCKYLNLPIEMSANAFLDAVNAVYNYEEFVEAVKLWQQEEARR